MNINYGSCQPRRIIFALALLKGKSVFLHQRPPNRQPYAGWWSLPAVSINSRDIGEDEALLSVENRLLASFIPEGSCKLFVARGARFRGQDVVVLYVSVYQIMDSLTCLMPDWGIPRLLSDVFCDEAILDPALSILGEALRNRLNFSEISPSCLEFPAELSDKSISAVKGMDPLALWNISHKNYALFLSGQAGGYGWITKKNILDRRISILIRTYLGKGGSILDYGGGDGLWLEDGLRPHYTIDVIDPIASYNRQFHYGLYDAAICSLVIPWVNDIDSIFADIENRLVANAPLIVTIPNPMIFRRGRWQSLAKGNFLIDRCVPAHGSLCMIGRFVGPLKLYARNISEIISTINRSGFTVLEIDDSVSSSNEIKLMEATGHPYPMQYSKVAPFILIVARKTI